MYAYINNYYIDLLSFTQKNNPKIQHVLKFMKSCKYHVQTWNNCRGFVLQFRYEQYSSINIHKANIATTINQKKMTKHCV